MNKDVVELALEKVRAHKEAILVVISHGRQLSMNVTSINDAIALEKHLEELLVKFSKETKGEVTKTSSMKKEEK